ncbi:MAG: MBOAT family protein [Polyangiaceae bacterium]
MIHYLPHFLFVTGAQISTGALVAGSKMRRWLTVAIAFATLGIPFLVPEDPRWVRSLIALGFVMIVLRTIDLAKEKTHRSLAFRIVHVAIPFDTRRLTPARTRVSIANLAKIMLFFALAMFCLHLVRNTGVASVHHPAELAVRWGGGLVLAYAITESAYLLAETLVRGAGFDVYELHRHPIASLSVKEFWGERWNRTVMAWLRENCLRPFARRKMARLGLVASFAASALLHAYLVIVSVDAAMALVMFAYFMLQAAFVLFEMKVRMQYRNRFVRRVWTLGVMIATSPMFVEPALQAIGI